MGEPQPVIWMTLRVWLKFSRKKQFCFPAAFFAPAYKFPACCPANGLQACPARSHNHISQFLGKEICVYVKVKATQSCLTLCNPMEFSRPWNSPGQNAEFGCCSLLQGIFPTQGPNPGLLPCSRILYPLSYQGSPCVCVYFCFSGRTLTDITFKLWRSNTVIKIMNKIISTFNISSEFGLKWHKASKTK